MDAHAIIAAADKMLGGNCLNHKEALALTGVGQEDILLLAVCANKIRADSPAKSSTCAASPPPISTPSTTWG